MPDAKGPTVLIAEDEGHCRLLLKTLLSSMNCEVVGEARTGEEAIELYRRLKPDILLLDINMPNKTGDEVLEEIRAEFRQIGCIIILTSVADERIVEKCLDLGAANYIRKDTPLAEIKTTIKEAWNAYVESIRDRTSLPPSGNH